MKPLISAMTAGLLMFGNGLHLDPTNPGGQSEATIRQDDLNTTVELAATEWINISGDGAGSGKGDGYRVPRPCWYEPARSGEDMYRFMTDPRTNARRAAIDEESRLEFLKPFEEKRDADGFWWVPNYDQNHPDGAACWGDLELFVFVPTGTTPPSGITPEQLAHIARGSLTVPEHTVSLNPDAKSFVNLPTWVWAEGLGDTTRTVTATIPGFMSVTVTATLESITIDPGTTKDRAETNVSGCGTTGKPYVRGGEFSCGVRYLRSSIDQPGSKYTLGVTSVWSTQATGDVAPFQLAPVEVEITRDVEVGEIQSNIRP
ncbi:hypothetical protein [Nonomuraea aridisoli]|uniref:Enoyl reductase n=1 Tax=Nonomuraea aridisoli TaxID=2070368 RepID=A0A2W2FEC9_9ACTN|nr:hypothetical protein [Nonomuraea aridisoli]PZG13824.1 hypothetical protein C1J01_28880 [Nonomuraea aridisoli]